MFLHLDKAALLEIARYTLIPATSFAISIIVFATTL